MTGFDKLEEFHFGLHGDGRERDWWHLVSSDFPAHEEFWRNYIVPLTNRVNPAINPQNDYALWIRTREGINQKCEQMAMHHYSVFYFLARATRALRVDKSFYPEDILYLLDSCGDNVHHFFKLIKQFAKRLGGSLGFLPNQEKDLCPEESRAKKMCERGGFVEVKKYRNALLHNPVLGRAIAGGIELLPKCEYLEQVQHSWREIGQLKFDQFTDPGELILRLHGEVVHYLQSEWTTIIKALDVLRNKPEFIDEMKLQGFLPIRAPEGITATTYQPFTASGGFPHSPTVADIIIPSNSVNFQFDDAPVGHPRLPKKGRL